MLVTKLRVTTVYDTGVANKLLFTTPSHVCGIRPGSTRDCHGCFGMYVLGYH